MPRLDARVQVELVGNACYVNNSQNHRKKVIIKELSLGGALVQGLPDRSEYVKIKSELLDGKPLEIEGEVVRFAKDGAGIELYNSSMATLETIWTNIRDSVLSQSSCPYCGSKRIPPAPHCDHCRRPLTFEGDDYAKKHFRYTLLERIKHRIDKHDVRHLENVINVLDEEISRGKLPQDEAEFVGTSPSMLEVFSMIRKVAPTDVNVLILGESGTGKELTARAIHERSPRKDKPFIAINSAAIPEGLLEAELFGYEKGAFTGAHSTRKGKFEHAAGGTIFLDEIGDLSSGLQAKVLRFLEDRIVERVGGSTGKKVDVRIISATNCKLKGMTAKGLFRNDLYFRLDGFAIHLPPLRERGEDKVVLAHYVLNKITKSENLPFKGFSPAAIDVIKSYDWPGNVRELINKIRRGQLMASGGEIHPEDMDLQGVTVATEPSTIKREVAQTQRVIVEKSLQEHNFVISRAAKALGISRPSLYALMKKYQIINPKR